MGTSNQNILIVTVIKVVVYSFLIQLKGKYKYLPYYYIFLLSIEMRLFFSFLMYSQNVPQIYPNLLQKNNTHKTTK